MTPGQNLKKTGPTPEVKEGLHKCTLCDSSFETVSGLHGHMNVHNKKYSCHLCGKCFRGPFAVQEHLKTHAGPSVKKETRDPILFPLECKVCKHRFANAITLRQHRNLHTERYQCDICGQSNKNADGLKRHMRKHTGEKPFGCRKCEYRSTRNSDIIRHMKTCNGKKRNQPLVVIRDEHAMKDDAVGMGLEMFLQASTSSEDDTRQDGFVGDYQERESSEASIGRMILVKEESDEFIQPAYEPQIDQPPIEGPSFVLSPQEMLLQIVKQEDKNIMDTDRPEDVASSNSNDHVDFETIDDCEEAIHAVDLFEEKPPIMSSVFEDDPTAKIEELTRLNEKLVQENLELRQMFSAELEKLKRNNTRLREENRRLKQEVFATPVLDRALNHVRPRCLED